MENNIIDDLMGIIKDNDGNKDEVKDIIGTETLNFDINDISAFRMIKR